MTTKQFEDRFPIGDDQACLSYLVARRWPEGVHCPRCGNAKVYDASAYKPFHWQCVECSEAGPYRFSALVGTIFENTKKPLRDWFRVAHYMFSSKKGMSALQIQRMMGFGSYETAHSMCHKIRAALIQPEIKLGGIVEIDETWVGGKQHNKHWDKKRLGAKGGAGSGKTPIIGAVERQGNVVARVLKSVTVKATTKFVQEVVSDKVSVVATDSWSGYEKLGANQTFQHGMVDHSKDEYVVGVIHTNTIEGFWSIFKRGVVGTFHKMSAKYMPLYVAEFQFRYNNRSNPDMFGTAIAGC